VYFIYIGQGNTGVQQQPHTKMSGPAVAAPISAVHAPKVRQNNSGGVPGVESQQQGKQPSGERRPQFNAGVGAGGSQLAGSARGPVPVVVSLRAVPPPVHQQSQLQYEQYQYQQQMQLEAQQQQMMQQQNNHSQMAASSQAQRRALQERPSAPLSYEEGSTLNGRGAIVSGENSWTLKQRASAERTSSDKVADVPGAVFSQREGGLADQDLSQR
jgi:hypothetical protein